MSPPVVLASNYRTYGYAREEGSPTWEAFEAAIGALEGGDVGRVLVRDGGGHRRARAAAGRARASSGRRSATRACAACWASARRRAGSRSSSVDMTDTDAVLRALRGRGAAVGRDADEPAGRRRRARPPRRGRARRRRRGRGRRHVRHAAAPAAAGARRRRRHPQRHEVHRRPLRPPARRRDRARRPSAPKRCATRAARSARRRERSRRSSRCAGCARWRCGSSAAQASAAVLARAPGRPPGGHRGPLPGPGVRPVPRARRAADGRLRSHARVRGRRAAPRPPRRSRSASGCSSTRRASAAWRP